MKTALGLATSSNLIGSLCKEIETIRSKYKFLATSINKCTDSDLIIRLNKELNRLIDRKNRIRIMAKSCKHIKSLDQLSIDFLLELCSRPLYAEI